MNILALQTGTSSVKAAVLESATGRSLGPTARVEVALESPAAEAVELPAERLWQGLTSAAREAVRRAGVAGSAGDVAGIGLAVFTPGLVLVDEAGEALRPIWTPRDRRARPVARQVWAAVGEEFLATTGNRPLPGVASVLSYRQMLFETPYLAHQIKSYLHVNGWLGLRMTGERAMDRANAGFTGLFNTAADGAWSPRWCTYFEVSPAWLPPVRDGCDTVGTLRSAVATELGVPAGIPVKIGTADVSCAMLGADMRPGDLLHLVGTTQTLAALAERARPSARRLTGFLGVGARMLHRTCNPVGPAALGWVRQLCFREQSEEEFYGAVVAAAQSRQTRITLDPPFLAGDGLEIEACRAAFRDLELTTERMDLLTAVLEALVRRHRQALADLEPGQRLDRVILSGPGAERIRSLIPEYGDGHIELATEPALHGVARLFGGAEATET